MGKCQCRLVFICISKVTELGDDVNEFFTHQLQGLVHHDNVSIIAYITGSSSQVDDSFCLRALYAICIYMGHDIVADDLFPFLRHFIIDILRMAFQLLDLFVGDGKSQLLLCLCQCDPESSPGAEFHIR